MSKMELPKCDGVGEALSWQQAQEAREARLFRTMAYRSDDEIARLRKIRRWSTLRLLWRLCRPVPLARKAVEFLILRGSPYFDSDWYLSNAPDVAASGLSAERHYLVYGGFEGRDPGPHFSSSTYLKLWGDVAVSGLNPLIHYHVAGKSEGRWAGRARSKRPALPPIPERVVYVVGHTLPFSSNGYAIRTHEVAKALGRAGHDVVVVLFPGRPWSIEGFAAKEPVQTDRRIEGVRYVTLPARDLLGLSQEAGEAASVALLSEAFAALRPTSVIAASNWRIARPTAEAARAIGAVFFYEQRGFWELGIADRANREIERAKEIEVARSARAVIALGPRMQEELERRAIPSERVVLVPNGIAPVRSGARAIHRKELGCSSRYLVGYVGSYASHEGIEDLFAAVAKLRRDGVDVDLLCAGGGEPKGLIGSRYSRRVELGAYAEKYGIERNTHILPRVPWAEIAPVYSLLDLVVVPRRDSEVGRLVPPLKPYGAAAHGCHVLMSDLPPLREIADEIGARVFPAGDVGALAEGIRRHLEALPFLGRPQSHWALTWGQRIKPLSRRLLSIEEEARRAQTAGAMAPFDIAQLPRAFLGSGLVEASDVGIGPCRHWPGALKQASRYNLLAEIATRPPATLVIDWTGIADARGEWEGLWGAEDIGLSKQVFDACQIALERGWHIRVLGPVPLSEAPLFAMVSGRVDIVEGEVSGKGKGEAA